jgi:hypothetical protein
VDSESFRLRQNDSVLLQVLGGHVSKVWKKSKIYSKTMK